MFEIQTRLYKQCGMLSVIVCAMLAVGFLIYSLQTISNSSMKLYHAANQAKIEVAGQLFAAGAQLIALRTSSTARLKAFYNAHHPGNSYMCSATSTLPSTLLTLGDIPPPDVNNDQQSLKIRVAFAPFSCIYGPMSEDNFRVNVEIIAYVGCNNANAEDCLSRTVTLGMKNSPPGVVYSPGLPPPPPSEPTPPDPGPPAPPDPGPPTPPDPAPPIPTPAPPDPSDSDSVFGI